MTLQHALTERVAEPFQSVNLRDWLTELGADQVIDCREADFAGVVSDVDLIIDTVGGDVAIRSRAVPGMVIVSTSR